MKKLQMVDLQNQYQNIKPQIDEAINKVLSSSLYINGEIVDNFKENLANYLNVKTVIPCANGTDAIMASIMSLDLEPGSEIITSDFSFIAAVEMIKLLGFKPVLVDVEEDSFNINADIIEKKISKKTKCIISVNIFGQSCNIEKIMEIAKKHNLYVIEDNAQSIGAEFTFNNNHNQKAGTIGHIGTTSFFPSKNLGCFGDGGAIFTNDNILADRIAKITNHGMKTRYHYDMVGINSRLDALQAAVLNVKLKYLDEYNQKRNQAAKTYNKYLSGIDKIITPYEYPKSSHIYHQYTLKVNSKIRDDLKKYLDEKSIPTMIYYPIPLHKHKPYASDINNADELIVSKKLSKSVISLPIHTEMDEEQIKYICENIINFL